MECGRCRRYATDAKGDLKCWQFGLCVAVAAALVAVNIALFVQNLQALRNDELNPKSNLAVANSARFPQCMLFVGLNAPGMSVADNDDNPLPTVQPFPNEQPDFTVAYTPCDAIFGWLTIAYGPWDAVSGPLHTAEGRALQRIAADPTAPAAAKAAAQRKLSAVSGIGRGAVPRAPRLVDGTIKWNTDGDALSRVRQISWFYPEADPSFFTVPEGVRQGMQIVPQIFVHLNGAVYAQFDAQLQYSSDYPSGAARNESVLFVPRMGPYTFGDYAVSTEIRSYTWRELLASTSAYANISVALVVFLWPVMAVARYRRVCLCPRQSDGDTAGAARDRGDRYSVADTDDTAAHSNRTAAPALSTAASPALSSIGLDPSHAPLRPADGPAAAADARTPLRASLHACSGAMDGATD